MKKLLLLAAVMTTAFAAQAKITIENIGGEAVVAEISVTEPTAGGKVIWTQTIRPKEFKELKTEQHSELKGKDLVLDIKSDSDGSLIAGTTIPQDEAYFYVAAKNTNVAGEQQFGGIYEWNAEVYTNKSSFNKAKIGRIPGHGKEGKVKSPGYAWGQKDWKQFSKWKGWTTGGEETE